MHDKEKYNQVDLVRELKVKHDEYRIHTDRELQIKEEIEKRLNSQIEVLTNELTIAKRIIGNPVLRDKGIKDLNFDKLFYYDHEMPLQQSFDKSKLSMNRRGVNRDLEDVSTTVRKAERPMTTMKEVPKLNFDCDEVKPITRTSLLRKFRQTQRSVHVSKVPQSTKASSSLLQ